MSVPFSTPQMLKLVAMTEGSDKLCCFIMTNVCLFVVGEDRLPKAACAFQLPQAGGPQAYGPGPAHPRNFQAESGPSRLPHFPCLPR